MICWSCEKDAGGGVFCGACRAIQPAESDLDRFAVLGAEVRFDVDEAELERKYRELHRLVHPDRFARADARARRASLARSVQLNQAWKTLRDPVKRAEYLLELHGIEVGGEEGTKRPGPDGRKERVPVPQELLLEVLDLREALLEARSEDDQTRVRALAAQVAERKSGAMAAVAAALSREPPALEAAARELVAVRYLDRFLEEVAAHEEDSGKGGAEMGGREVTGAG
jgi:molecular chaperone HscB